MVQLSTLTSPPCVAKTLGAGIVALFVDAKFVFWWIRNCLIFFAFVYPSFCISSFHLLGISYIVGLFGNRVMVWQLGQFSVQSFVWKLIYWKSEAFNNWGSTVYTLIETPIVCWNYVYATVLRLVVTIYKPFILRGTTLQIMPPYEG